MGSEDVKIRDLSRGAGAWTPPISAMGGPPAHQLYSDLVAFAGLQLYRDARSRPWIVLRDGVQRRAFLAPSVELRSALDRFRMRRNLRPLTETTIDEFVRIVEARISDPDVAIPVLRAPIAEPFADAPVPLDDSLSDATPSSRLRELEEGIDSALRDLDQLEQHATRSPVDPDPSQEPEVVDEGEDADEAEEPASVEAPPSPPAVIDPSISGARAFPAVDNPGLDRYVRVLGKLVHEGGWLGTTQELSRLVRDDPITLFDSLLRYRSGLADHNILIANIEVEGAYRWLAVDRTRLRGVTGDAYGVAPDPPGT